MALDVDVGDGKKRHVLSIRTTEEGRLKLERAAKFNGRSMSEEIDRRLEQSFAKDERAGGIYNAIFLDRLAATIRDIEASTGQEWPKNEFTWWGVKRAILSALNEHRPASRDTPSVG